MILRHIMKKVYTSTARPGKVPPPHAREISLLNFLSPTFGYLYHLNESGARLPQWPGTPARGRAFLSGMISSPLLPFPGL